MDARLEELFSLLPALLGGHISVTVTGLGIGIAISLPLAIALVKTRAIREVVMTGIAVIQTIPGLALLALMYPLLAFVIIPLLGLSISPFGFYPVVIALTLYSMLPIVRNTVTGILGVDPAMTEAARGMGMTAAQTLWRVELPLALPVIIAGIRTATVWVVGIATLATPMGQSSLGNYIFTGLQTRNHVMVLFGCVFAAVLAIVLEQLVGLLERATTQRSRSLAIAAAVGLLVVFLSPYGIGAVERMRTVETGPRVLVGAKTFTEQYILAEVLAQTVRDAGYAPRKIESLGSAVVFDALALGDIDVYVDYSGTIWANYMHRTESADPQTVLREMSRWLEDEYGIVTVGALGFENAYALAMRRQQAEELGIRTIRDLAAHAPNMTIGGDYEFFGRPEWEQLRDVYDLSFSDQRSMDSTFMYEAAGIGEVDVISAFSSDGRIAAFDLVVLEDPLHAIPPYDAVLLISARAAEDPGFVESLRPLVGAIDDDAMREANRIVDVEGRSIAAAAEYLLGRIPPASNAPSSP